MAKLANAVIAHKKVNILSCRAKIIKQPVAANVPENTNICKKNIEKFYHA